jgi:hypothetical protein
MEIFNGMDSSDFLMKGELVPGNYVFKAPEKPKIFDGKKKRFKSSKNMKT